MSLTPITVAQGTGSGSLATAYTVAANQVLVITASVFNNPTGGTLSLDQVILNAGTDREVVSSVSLLTHKSYVSPELQGQTLQAGGVLKINAASGIDYWISGILSTVAP